MGETTGISWTDATFNPWEGCAKVSPGCTNCYAETRNKRFGGDNWGVGKPRRRTSEANWRQPLKWNREAGRLLSGELTADPDKVRRPRVFCASLADWLDPEVPVQWLADLLALIGATPNLDWQLLTKRPELWRERMQAVVAHGDAKTSRWSDKPAAVAAGMWLAGIRIPPNVWIGCTVEDQRRADERIHDLMAIPAMVQFLSMEPLLEAVQIPLPFLYYKGAIQWVIVGGESGHHARPFNLGWARGIVKQCKAAGVDVFVKQMGDAPLAYLDKTGAPDDGGDIAPLIFRAHHGADPSEWPEDLRVQEFPG